MIFKQADVHRHQQGKPTDMWLRTKSKGERDLLDRRLVPFSVEHGGSVLLS